MAARDGSYLTELYEQPSSSKFPASQQARAGEVINILPPLPIITSFTPSSMAYDADDVIVAVTGTDFTPGMTCSLGAELTATVTFISSTSLSVEVDTTGAPVAGSRPFTLTDTYNRVISDTDTAFTVVQPAGPVITDINPNVMPVGSDDFIVTVTGTGFVPGMTCNLGPNLTATVTYVSPILVTVEVDTPGVGVAEAVAFILTEPVFGRLATAPEVFIVGVGDVDPVISNVFPAPGTPINRNTPVSFLVTDFDANLFREFVTARFPGQAVEEVVFDGFLFNSQYSASTRTSIPGGFSYTLRRTGGWSGPPTIRVFAFDQTGNEL